MPDNLWPSMVDIPQLRGPLQILREQAQFLGGMTGQLLEARVQQQVLSRSTTVPRDVYPSIREWLQDGGQVFVLTFEIYAEALEYVYEVLTVYHNIELYPVLHIDEPRMSLKNEEELKAFLASQLRSERTKSVIAALLAQLREP